MRTIRLILSALLLAALVGCAGAQSGGTTTGNPLVSMSFAGFDDTAPMGKVRALSTISSLTFCFKRLRFKGDGESNLDFNIGEIQLNPTGTDLSMVRVPKGVYTRVEFDLESSCPGGKSISLTNGHGSYSTTDTITIKFDGSFVVNEGLEQLTLFLAAIVSNLEGVMADSDIRLAAQTAAGNF